MFNRGVGGVCGVVVPEKLSAFSGCMQIEY